MFRNWSVFVLVPAFAFITHSARAAEPGAVKVLTPDARGFIHVRVGDIWSAEVARQLRTFTAQAGGGLLADFDRNFYPAPSEVESFTVVISDTKFRDILPAGRPTDITPVWVVTSKKPLDKAELLKTMAKTGKPRKHAGKDYYFDETYWSGILLLDGHSYAYASEDAIRLLIDRMAKGGQSPLAGVLTREADKHPVTVGVSVAAVANPNMLKGLPAELIPLSKAKTLVATVDLKPKTSVAVALEFPTEADANAGLKAAQEGVQLARGQIGNALSFVEMKAKRDPAKGPAGIQEFPETVGLVLAAAGLKQLDALLGAMPVKAIGTTVQASLELDSVLPGGSTAASIGVVAMAIGYAMSNADRDSRSLTPGNYDWTERERNLASVAKAIEKYRADKGHYPPPAILDKDGKPLLSWRVAILPYMENVYINSYGPYEPNAKRFNSPKELYDAFKLDEPWDGPNNKKLIDKFPSVYRAPWNVLSYAQSSVGKTVTLAVTGKGTIFDPTKKVTTSDVRDGLKQTLLLLQLEESSQAVYWTKPADVTLTADGKLPEDGPNPSRRFAVVYADGSAHTLVNGVDVKTFLGIVTRNGNEKLDEMLIRPEPIKSKDGPFPPK
jgi:hypothetical protein